MTEINQTWINLLDNNLAFGRKLLEFSKIKLNFKQFLSCSIFSSKLLQNLN